LVHTVDSLFGLIRGPMEKRMKIKLIANRDGGYNESFKMYRMSYEFAKLIEETDPASEFYSDDDDTQNLENQMRNQYQTAQTTLPPNFVPYTPAQIAEPHAQKSEQKSTNYDDILSMIQ
jgi:hypothetical protein